MPSETQQQKSSRTRDKMDKLYSVETKTIAKKKLTTKPRREDNGTQRVDVTLEVDGTKKLAMMSMNGQVVTKKVVVGYSEYKFIPGVVVEAMEAVGISEYKFIPGVEGVTFPPGEFIPEVVVEARKDLRDSYKPSEGLEVKLVPLRGGARRTEHVQEDDGFLFLFSIGPQEESRGCSTNMGWWRSTKGLSCNKCGAIVIGGQTDQGYTVIGWNVLAIRHGQGVKQDL